jgi:hypothetical protein
VARKSAGSQQSTGKRWLIGIVSQLLVLAIPVGFAYFMYRSEQAEVAQRADADRAEQATRGTLFARGKLGEMLELCGKGWTNLGLTTYDEPVALAWTRKGLYGYFHQGADPTSLRQLRCDAAGTSKGPRVSHPLHEQLPAEAPTQSEQDESKGEWRRAVEDASARPLEASEVAVELLAHPVTGHVLTRRWRSGDGGAVPSVEPQGAPAFASLLPAGQIAAAASSTVAPLPALRGHRWTVETDAAFGLLYKQIPKGALISELRFEDEKIEVEIQHPTKAFDGKPDAPYGDKDFDEYGVADLDWWYPRSELGFSCGQGTPLADVQAQYAAARANAGPRIAWAWFSCSTAYSNGRVGTWHIVSVR